MLSGRVRFDRFEANLESGELWRDGELVPLQDLPFRLLTALVQRPGEVVTRAELAEQLWGSDTFVDAAAGLNTAVAKLREALEDDAERPQLIETVPKRGYRFVGVVDPIAPARAIASSLTAIDETRAAHRSADHAGAGRDASRVEAAPSAAIAAPDALGATSGTLTPARRHALVAASVAVALAVAAIAAYQLRASRPQIRVAVVLFDNETGKPELTRLAQGLTDATVAAMAAEPRLAVIGNAAILRTARSFRDIAAIRDALAADYIVIGQVQTRDAAVIVRTHLIRAKDQSHRWVGVATMTASEAALQAEVADNARAAIIAHALDAR